jgi:hypothetical protein
VVFVFLSAVAALATLLALTAGHLALTFRRRWLTACVERDEARAEARSARHDATACRAALSLNEALSCGVCRAWRAVPHEHRRRAPAHPS